MSDYRKTIVSSGLKAQVKFCEGCGKDHPLDEFATTNGKPKKNCKAFLRIKENANKKAPTISEP